MDIPTRNALNLKISKLQLEVERNKQTIERFESMDEHGAFYKKKADQLKTDNKTKQDDINRCKNALSSGSLGDLVLGDVLPRQTQAPKPPKVAAVKPKFSPEKKAFNPQQQRFVSSFALDKEEERLEARVARLPDFIKRNLKGMPNNRGYIYSGIWLFGERPAQGDTIYMNEIRKGGSLYHEITATRRLVTEKIDGRVHVVSDSQRYKI